MTPLLNVLVRAACRFAKTSDPRACANGYAHTYFDPGDIDLARLSLYPSDDELRHVACEAWEEAMNLWDLLGVTPSDLLTPTAPPPSFTVHPSVSSWFAAGKDPVYDYYSHDVSDDESDADADEPSLSEQLQKLVDEDENAPIVRTAVTDRRMLALKCAAVALTLSDISEASVSYSILIMYHY